LAHTVKLALVVERAFPKTGFGVLQAHGRLVMTEITFHRQGGRGENPSPWLRIKLFTKPLGDTERRGMQLHGVTEHLHPTH